MNRWLVLPVALLATASGAAQQSPFEARLEAVRKQAAQADEAADAYRADAEAVRSEAERLALEAQARAEQIGAAEARLSETLIELESLRSARSSVNAKLERQRRPLAYLIAGLATLSRQPPLAALADASSAKELVRLQLLIDSSLPAIERRSAGLEADLLDLDGLDRAADAKRAELLDRRGELDRERQRFAEAEARQRAAAGALEAAAFGATSRRIAIREELADLDDEGELRAKARAEARELASYPGPALGPRPGTATPGTPQFAYRLPADADVSAGVGSVSADGIRARGITLATGRGARITVPASGAIGFAGAFRGRDTIVVIDHGGGWISLLTGVSTRRAKGEIVALGDALGRATGPVQVELWKDGRPVSPALTAGSSRALSNPAKAG